jgi:hypothetical protein
VRRIGCDLEGKEVSEVAAADRLEGAKEIARRSDEAEVYVVRGAGAFDA